MGVFIKRFFLLFCVLNCYEFCTYPRVCGNLVLCMYPTAAAYGHLEQKELCSPASNQNLQELVNAAAMVGYRVTKPAGIATTIFELRERPTWNKICEQRRHFIRPSQH